jgi:hypothetical protein
MSFGGVEEEHCKPEGGGGRWKRRTGSWLLEEVWSDRGLSSLIVNRRYERPIHGYILVQLSLQVERCPDAMSLKSTPFGVQGDFGKVHQGVTGTSPK